MRVVRKMGKDEYRQILERQKDIFKEQYQDERSGLLLNRMVVITEILQERGL